MGPTSPSVTSTGSLIKGRNQGTPGLWTIYTVCTKTHTWGVVDTLTFLIHYTNQCVWVRRDQEVNTKGKLKELKRTKTGLRKSIVVPYRDWSLGFNEVLEKIGVRCRRRRHFPLVKLRTGCTGHWYT